MQGRGQQGAADDVQPVGDTREPAQQPADKGRPLIPQEWGAVVGALITAAGSLLVYSLAMVNHIDERLDRLEQEARELLDGAGNIKPSQEALRSYFAVEHLKERVERLEGRGSDPSR